MLWAARTTVFSFLSFAVLAPALLAQDARDPNPPPTPQKLDKEQKRKLKKTLKELDTPYKQWLNEDVVYIISPEERRAFLQLDTNEEREQFIEQFWLRRDPPGSSPYTFRAEHYRRIAYANQHFAGSVPGWETDRGRIFILYGRPSSIDVHPAADQSFETWSYKDAPGLGQIVELKFVDVCKCGNYQLQQGPISSVDEIKALRKRCPDRKSYSFARLCYRPGKSRGGAAKRQRTAAAVPSREPPRWSL